jgi:hypothetical protein
MFILTPAAVRSGHSGAARRVCWWPSEAAGGAVRILGEAEGTLYGLVAASYVASTLDWTMARLLGLNLKAPARMGREPAGS